MVEETGSGAAAGTDEGQPFRAALHGERLLRRVSEQVGPLGGVLEAGDEELAVRPAS